MTLEELNSHYDKRRQKAEAEELLAALRLEAEPGAARLTGMPHTPGVKDKVGDLGAEIADTLTYIEALEAEIEQQESEIAAFISEIKDIRTRTIFRLRFLRGLTWKEVSRVCGRFTTEKSVSDLCYKYLKSSDINGE